MTATTAGNSRTRSGGRARTAKGNAARRVHARAHTRDASTAKKWSKHVTETSDAMDLEHDVFKTGDADAIAASLKRSANKSHRRKGSPFQSAMSMLNFYTNRAGRNLSKSRRQILQDAKKKLREAFGRAP